MYGKVSPIRWILQHGSRGAYPDHCFKDEDTPLLCLSARLAH